MTEHDPVVAARSFRSLDHPLGCSMENGGRLGEPWDGVNLARRPYHLADPIQAAELGAGGLEQIHCGPADR
jgi:hypothetical protein